MEGDSSPAVPSLSAMLPNRNGSPVITVGLALLSLASLTVECQVCEWPVCRLRFRGKVQVVSRAPRTPGLTLFTSKLKANARQTLFFLHHSEGLVYAA
jgi:hypothetical protein